MQFKVFALTLRSWSRPPPLRAIWAIDDIELAPIYFFEGLSALREAIVAGINGGVHASLAVLRGVFEMFALHCYWKQRRTDEDTYDEFYRWFGGTEKAPGFGRLLDLCYAQSLPAATTSVSARTLYGRLCSYVHVSFPSWCPFFL
jgi:hypothetical protein